MGSDTGDARRVREATKKCPGSFEAIATVIQIILKVCHQVVIKWVSRKVINLVIQRLENLENQTTHGTVDLSQPLLEMLVCLSGRRLRSLPCLGSRSALLSIASTSRKSSGF